MAVDLRALRAQAHGKYGEQEGERQFWLLVKALAKTDLLAFGLWTHGQEHPVLAQLAMSRHAYVIATLYERHDRLLVVTPPEHGKTTIGRWYLEWFLGSRTQEAFEKGTRPPTALLVSNTAGQAQKRIMSIAATIEANRRFQALFPRCQPDKAWGWGKELLYLKRPSPLDDPSLMGTGIPGQVQGGRLDLVLVDDPTDQQDARSDTIMQGQMEFHFGVLNDRLLEGAKQIDNLTRWGNGKYDIARNCLESPEWASVVMPVYDFWTKHPEYGVTHRELWPDVWPEPRVERKRREKQMVQNGALFQLAFMCDPVLAEGEMFKRAWIQRAPTPIRSYVAA